MFFEVKKIFGAAHLGSFCEHVAGFGLGNSPRLRVGSKWLLSLKRDLSAYIAAP